MALLSQGSSSWILPLLMVLRDRIQTKLSNFYKKNLFQTPAKNISNRIIYKGDPLNFSQNPTTHTPPSANILPRLGTYVNNQPTYHARIPTLNFLPVAATPHDSRCIRTYRKTGSAPITGFVYHFCTWEPSKSEAMHILPLLSWSVHYAYASS